MLSRETRWETTDATSDGSAAGPAVAGRWPHRPREPVGLQLALAVDDRHAGADEAGSEAVDEHAVAAQLQGQRAGGRIQPPLAES